MSRQHTYLACSLLLLMLFGVPALGQERPQWSQGYFREVRNSYIESVQGRGYSQEQARKAALSEAMVRRNLGTGAEVRIHGQNATASMGDQRLEVKIRVVAEHYERLGPGDYVAYLLVQTAKHPTLEFDPVRVGYRTPGYMPLIPGMAQIQRGHKAWGVTLIIAQAATLGGALALGYMASNAKGDIANARSTAEYEAAVNRNRQLLLARNVAFGTAAAVYVLNIIDGYVGKGRQQVLLSSRVRLAPIVGPEHGGIYVCVNF